MKPKGKDSYSDKKPRNQAQVEIERRELRRRFWLRVAAILLILVFLASECSTLLPME